MSTPNQLTKSGNVTATWATNGILVSGLPKTLGNLGETVTLTINLPKDTASQSQLSLIGSNGDTTIAEITPHLRAIIQSLITTKTESTKVNEPIMTTEPKSTNRTPTRLPPLANNTNEDTQKTMLKKLLNLHAKKLRATEGSPNQSPRSDASINTEGSDSEGSTVASAADTESSRAHEASMAPTDNQTQSDFTDILTAMINQKNTPAIHAFFESEAATSFIATLTDDTLNQITTQLVQTFPQDSFNLSLLLDAIKAHKRSLLAPFLQAFSEAAISKSPNSGTLQKDQSILNHPMETIFKQALNALINHSEETALGLAKNSIIVQIITGINHEPGTPMNQQLMELDMRMNYPAHIQKLEREIQKKEALIQDLETETDKHTPTHFNSTEMTERTLPIAQMSEEDRNWHNNHDKITELEEAKTTLETKKNDLETIKEEEKKSQTDIATKCKALAKALEVENQLLSMLNDIKTITDNIPGPKENEKKKVTSTIHNIPNLLAHPYGLMIYKQVTQGRWGEVNQTLEKITKQRTQTSEQQGTQNTKDALKELLKTNHPDVLKTLPLQWKENDGRLTPLRTVSDISNLKDPALTAILQNPTVGACLVTEAVTQFHEFIDNIYQKDPNLAMAFKQLNNTLKKYEADDTSAIPLGSKKKTPTELRTTMATHLLTWVSEHVTDFKRWPMDAVRQAYALLAPAIGKSTTPEGLTPPLTTANEVIVDSQVRQQIEDVNQNQLKKLGITEGKYQNIILKNNDTKLGFLALQKRLEANCPGSHCIHVPQNLTQPSDSTGAGPDQAQSQPIAFVRSGRTTNKPAIIELLTGSATTIFNQLNKQGKGTSITTPPTDNDNMHAKNQELMGTGFCWKETNQAFTLHFQAHICTGMDDSLWKKSDEQPWLNDMHTSVTELTEEATKNPLSSTINDVSFTIDPPMVTEHPQSKIGLSDIGSSKLGVPSMFASAQNKAKKSLPQKIDTIIEQHHALGKDNNLFINTLKKIKTKTTDPDKLTTEINKALLKPEKLSAHEKMFLRSIMHLYEKPQPPRPAKATQVSTDVSRTFYQTFTIETLDLAFSALANCTPCYQCKSGQDRTKTMSILHEMANHDTYLTMLANGFKSDAERKQFGLKFFELATQNLGIAVQARPGGIGSAIIKWNLNHALDDHPIPKQMLGWACLPNVGNETIQTLQSNLNEKRRELMQLGAKQLKQINKLKRNSKKTTP
ncbi:MAG: hypothetical protein ISQ13_00105 [Candidatus Margulisbacteria bacterium]|nr:hypothetical protein [Candidatus Margulisiibacteriota bacterium]